MNAKIKYIDSLVNHLLEQKSTANMEETLRHLLTSSELADICNRLQIFALLQQGIPQRQIADQLGVGIATVTRGSSALKNRINNTESAPQKKPQS